MVFFMGLLLVLLCWRLKIERVGFADSFSPENTKYVRGVCALVVIIHHLAQATAEKSVVSTVFLGSGYLAVACFFFYSGFGLLKSHIHKPDYANSFFSKRILGILIPLAVFMASYRVCGLKPVSGAWYLLVTLAFYLAFWVMMHTMKQKYWLIFFCSVALCVLWAAFGVHMKLDTYLYNTCFCIPLGMLLALVEHPVVDRIQKHYFAYAALFLVTMAGAIFASFFLANTELLKLIFSCIGCIAFVMTIQIFTMKAWLGNMLWAILSECSLEIYMTHRLIMKLLRSKAIYLANDILWGILVICLSIPVAHILHKVFVKITNQIRKTSIRP